MSYPFYDLVNKNIKDKDLTLNQKKKMINKINKFDNNGKELIYAIIKVYEIKNTSKFAVFNLPYSGITVDNNVIFDLEKLPFNLKQMLNKFVNLHYKKIVNKK